MKWRNQGDVWTWKEYTIKEVCGQLFAYRRGGESALGRRNNDTLGLVAIKKLCERDWAKPRKRGKYNKKPLPDGGVSVVDFRVNLDKYLCTNHTMNIYRHGSLIATVHVAPVAENAAGEPRGASPRSAPPACSTSSSTTKGK